MVRAGARAGRSERYGMLRIGGHAALLRGGARRDEETSRVATCVEIKFYGAFALNRRFVLHAIDATPARWRSDAGSSLLDGAKMAALSPRNDLVKSYRVHPTHWLISTQVARKHKEEQKLAEWRENARIDREAREAPKVKSRTRRRLGLWCTICGPRWPNSATNCGARSR